MFNDFLILIAAAVQNSGLTDLVAEPFWVVPTFQTVHILCIAVVLVGALFINLRVLGVLDTGQPMQIVAHRFLPAMTAALIMLLATGLVLLIAEPTRAPFRTLFWLKMALVITAVLITRWQSRRFQTGQTSGMTLAGSAVLSLGLWLGIIGAGRWIAYVEAWRGAPV